MFVPSDIFPLILGFVSLCAIEIILAVDNVLFISIVAERLPQAQRRKARVIGLSLGLIFRIIFLFSISWLTGLTADILSFGFLSISISLSWRDIILILGGAFLVVKATHEIVREIEYKHDFKPRTTGNFVAVIVQIAVLDVVFSIDSVLTAIGLVEEIWVMVAAICVSMVVMIIAAEGIARFIATYPSLKILGLCFLVLIGLYLFADGFGQHFDKNYIYSAMAFSSVVIVLNIMVRKSKPGQLEKRAADD